MPARASLGRHCPASRCAPCVSGYPSCPAARPCNSCSAASPTAPPDTPSAACCWTTANEPPHEIPPFGQDSAGAPVIRRGVLARLLVFTVIAVLGIGYVLYEYVGVGAALLGRQYTVYLDLPDSGGIFSTASVTYRGVEIGRVGAITLRPGGIRVALNLSTSYKIPSNVAAYVATGSPIGEQYVDLR